MRLVARRVAPARGIVGAGWVILAMLGVLGEAGVVGVVRPLVLAISICLTLALVGHLLRVKLVAGRRVRPEG